jgi:hypothetical protein
MIEKDFLMRLLKQFIEELNELLFNIKKDDSEQAEVDIEALYEKYFQQKRTFFYDNDKEVISRIIISDDDVQSSVTKCEMLGILLLTDSKLNHTSNLRSNLLTKALFLLEYAENNSNSYSMERLDQITWIKAEIGKSER